MNNSLKLTLIGLAVLSVVILIGIFFVVSSLILPHGGQNIFSPGGSPTPITASSGTPNPKTYTFTPLQKTKIGISSDKDIQKLGVISKKTVGNTTIYKIKSIIPTHSDEIRTENGRVIFESTDTRISSPAPKTIASFESTFGKPEEIIKGVGPIGWNTSAYLYPSKGFMFYANRYTNTVYDIQRFSPMSLNEYKKTYAEFLKTATPDAAP